MRILVKGACVVTVDADVGDLPVGDILIMDGTIRQVAPSIDAPDADIIDAAGFIAIPGFVDGHRHLWEGALRSVTADYSILDFVGNVRLLAAQFFRPEDMYAAAYHGALEAIEAGVTTVADYCHNCRTVEHIERAIAGVRDAGLRTVWGYSFTGLAPNGVRHGGLDGEIEMVERLATEIFADDPLLTLGICPEEPMHWEDDDRVVKQVALARRLGAPMFMHVNSVPRPDGSLEHEVDRLDALGCLGEDFACVHMGFTSPDEWALLGRRRGHAVFTPETELQMGLGWPAISEARMAGVNIGLGIDITANNSADLFTQMRLALQVERGRLMAAEPGRQFQGGAPIKAADALEWATMGSARACGLADRVGSLTAGKAADVVLLKADDLSLAGWDRRNPVATVVQQAGVRHVDTVLIGGRIMKRHGKLVADVAPAIRAIEATSAHIHAEVAAAGGFDATTEVLHHRLGFGPLPESTT